MEEPWKTSIIILKPRLEAYDGHNMRSLGKFNALFESNGNTKFNILELLVVESEKNFGLLGRDALSNFDAEVHQVSSFQPAVDSYLPTIKGVIANMQLIEGSSAMFCKARQVPLPMQEKVAAELDRLEKIGVISKMTKGSANASPVVWVRKPDGNLRICVDYKVHVNRKIKTDAYPLPNIETIFASMKNAKRFAKLDLTSAYWQIELDEAAKDISVINTSQGLYYVNRLQMGRKNASAIFQRVMEQVLSDIKGILIYQDDVLIFAENDEALEKRLRAVKTRLAEKRITINQEKSIKLTDNISFLGFHLSARGIEPDVTLVKKLVSIKPPTNKREVESFVGLINYFGRLIPNLSTKLASLNNLRKNNTAFIWSPKCNQDFEK